MDNSYNAIQENTENYNETEHSKIYNLHLDEGTDRELIFNDHTEPNHDFGLFKDQLDEESAIYEIEFQIYDKTKNIVSFIFKIACQY
jgi:hypothetical protein